MIATQSRQATPPRSSRFANNLNVAPQDRRRALGFAPGLRMSMNPRGSNLAGYNVPQGQLLVFNPRLDGYLKEKMKSVVNPKTAGETLLSWDAFHEYSGMHFARAVASKFQGGVNDFGFRILECLNDLDYDTSTGRDDADEYFAVVHPYQLSCPMGLETVLRGPAGDILNGGLPWPCATCRIEWLKTEAPRVIAESHLDQNLLEELRQVLLQSYETGRLYAQTKFDRSAGEVNSTDPNTKKRFDDSEYFFMKILHKKPEHIEQAEIQSEAARIQGEAIGRSVAEAISAQSALAEVERLKAEIAAMRAKEQGEGQKTKKETTNAKQL